jgi:hypothetical protein
MGARSAHVAVRWLRVVVLVVAVAALGSVLVSGRAAAAASGSPSAPYVDMRAFSGHGDLAFVSLGDLYVLDGADGHLVASPSAS